MSRLELLRGMYWKATYILYAERELAQPSQAVIFACETAKRVAKAEYEAITNRGSKPNEIAP